MGVDGGDEGAHLASLAWPGKRMDGGRGGGGEGKAAVEPLEESRNKVEGVVECEGTSRNGMTRSTVVVG